MRSIFYNSYDSRISLTDEAFAWKMGYLLADESISASLSTLTVGYTDMLREVKNIDTQLSLLENRPSVTEEEKEMFAMIAKSRKLEKKVKHKTKELIVSGRTLANSINEVFKKYIEHTDRNKETAGYCGMDELEREKRFDFYEINYPNPEDEKEGFNTASSLLTSIGCSTEEEPEIFVLPSNFFTSEFSELIVSDANDEKAMQPENTYLHKCFDLPFLSVIKIPELKLIRKQLLSTADMFRYAMNGWIKLCQESDDMAARLDYFKAKVLPTCELLQQQTLQNEILNDYRKNERQENSRELWIGEIPITKVWDFYRFIDVIKDSTWELLEKARENNKLFDKRFPFMVLKNTSINNDELENEPQQFAFAAKKSISIDD